MKLQLLKKMFNKTYCNFTSLSDDIFKKGYETLKNIPIFKFDKKYSNPIPKRYNLNSKFHPVFDA